jgi:hypothetical protein
MAELTDVGVVEVDTADMTDDDMLAGRQGAVAGLARYTLGKLKAYFLSGGATLPPGGTTGQVLTKSSGADGDADWSDPTGGGGGGGGDGIIRFASFFTTTPAANEALMAYTATDAFTLPADLDGSEFRPMDGSVNPTADIELSLQLNGVEFGTITISTTGVVTFDSPETEIADQDVITLIAPADSEGIANWSYAFRAAGAAPAPEAAFDDTMFYGTFAKWTAAKARGAGAPARALFSGDSNVAGEGATGVGGAAANGFLHGFARGFAEDMGWLTGSIYGNQNVGNMAAFESYNQTVSHTGGWGVGTGGADIIGGTFLTSSSGGGGYLEWTPDEEFANLKIVYPTNPGLNGALTLTIDGVLIDTFNQNVAAGIAVEDYAVTGGMGTHTVRVGCSGSGDAYFNALEISDDIGTPVYVQGGWSGGKAADFAKVTAAWSSLNELAALDFDYVLHYCTINDADAGTAGQDYYKGIEALVAKASETADGCLIMGYPLDDDNTLNGYYNSQATMLRNIARDYGWSFFDSRRVFGRSYLKCQALGYAYDRAHPDADGHGALQAALTEFLGSKL